MIEVRTIEAAREVVYAMLTQPPLAYVAQDGTAATLPIADVVPRNVWEIGANAAMPLVTISAGATKTRYPAITRATGERPIALTITAVSSKSESEVVSISEAITTLLDFGDQERNAARIDISRVGTASTQPITVRYLEITHVGNVNFEEATSRYTVQIQAEMIAA